MGLLLHELFVGSHSSVAIYSRYWLKIVQGEVVMHSKTNTLQKSCKDMLVISEQAEPNKTSFDPSPPKRSIYISKSGKEV